MPTLDFAALTAPIPGEQPAGARLPPDLRKKMEDARKEFEPNPDDPSAPPLPKKPDWAGIVKWASESLSGQSKDLLAAVRLVEALAQRDSFAGLRDGLHLLRLLVTECWDRMHPLLEEPDDLEYRAGPIQWLCERESGAWFPNAVEKFPFLSIGGKTATLRDCKDGRLDGEPLSLDSIRAAEPISASVVEEVAACLAEMQVIDQVLTQKMAEQAPSLAGLKDVVAECQRFLNNLTSAAEGSADVSPGSGAAPADGQPSKPGAQTSRAEAYRQLARLADELARMEPHSPIPDLLRWAVHLGSLPFRDLIQELVQEPNVLADIRRQLGIKAPETPE